MYNGIKLPSCHCPLVNHARLTSSGADFGCRNVEPKRFQILLCVMLIELAQFSIICGDRDVIATSRPSRFINSSYSHSPMIKRNESTNPLLMKSVLMLKFYVKVMTPSIKNL